MKSTPVTVRTARLLTVAAAGALLAACGVATQAGPRAIPRTQVPFDLLDPNAPSATTTPPASNVVVYFVDQAGHVAPVQRAVTAPQRLLSVMNALVAGPTSTEQTNDGLSSSIPPTVRVLNASLQSGGVAVVNFNSTFIQIGSSSQVAAVAQVVYTATRQPGVASVQFEINGSATDVPTASNAEVSRPVTRTDYEPQAPTTQTALP